MIFIFEDSDTVSIESGNVYVGISYLLKYVYEGIQNVAIDFARSNMLLKKRVQYFVENREIDEVIYVYMDLVADNVNTWGIFYSLIRNIVDKQLRNIFIIPIPSIEYIFI